MKKLIYLLFLCLSANVVFAQACDVLAGEPTQANTILCDDQVGDYPVAGFFDAASPGTENPADVVTEYVQVDALTGEIISIFAGPNFDLSTAVEGETYCFHQVVYTQATVNDLLDQINGFCLTLDQIQPLLDLLGVEIPIPLPGDTEICVCDGFVNLELIAPLIGIELPFTCPIEGTLSSLVDALGGIGALTGGALPIDIPTLENIILNGFDINDLDPTGTLPDLPAIGAGTVCADFSNVSQCVSVEICEAVCEITAVQAATPVCSADATTYTVEVTVLGADTSVTLEDANSVELSQAASGTVTFTYPAGVPSSISVVDSEGICSFAQSDQAAPDCTTACAANAPTISNDGGDCDEDPNGSGDNTPFIFAEDGTGNEVAPFFTEYIVTDGASGGIVGVYSTLAEAETAANTEALTNGDACIQAINHEGLTDVVADLDAQTGGLLCGFGIVTCPVNELAVLSDALTATGATLTVADVIALVGPPDTGVTGFDIGALLGLPFPLVVDIPPFCYALGNEDCVTVAACAMPTCQGLAAAPALSSPVNLCDGDGPIDICFDMIDATEGLNFEVNIGGMAFGVIAGVAGDVPNTLCIQLPTVENTTCDVISFDLTFNSITCDNGVAVPGPSGGDLATDLGTFVINVYPQLTVSTNGDATCETLTAELVATDLSVCTSVTALACANDGDALSYDFSTYAYGDGVLATATNCPIDTPTGTLTCTDCEQPVPLNLTIADPCNCENGADIDGDGINDLALETITVTGGDGNYTMTFVDGLADMTNMMLPTGPVGSTIIGYVPTNGNNYTITVQDGSGNEVSITGGPCTACAAPMPDVPTVGEWGLIILGLMMSITAIVGIRARRDSEVWS